MADIYLTLKRFHQEEIEIVKNLTQRLRELNIEFKVEDNSKFPEPSFDSNQVTRDIRIKLKPADINIAQKELENYYGSQTGYVDPAYYLFEFTSEELEEIIERQDEWDEFDIRLAQKILKDRGREIKKTNDRLALPGPYRRLWIYLGYFCTIPGGLLGIIIGWLLYYSKKTSPDGKRFYSYSEWERMHGKLILLLGSIILPIWIIIKIRYQSEKY